MILIDFNEKGVISKKIKKSFEIAPFLNYWYFDRKLSPKSRLSNPIIVDNKE
jgi:hypothetical protein